MGGPSVFAKNFVEECMRRGHKIVYDIQKDCDCALIVSTTNEDVFHKCQKHNIKTVLRLDGFYIPEYWDNRDGRNMTADKIAVNNIMRKDLKRYDEIIFQSHWSKEMFDRWLGERKDRYSVIYNGVNTAKFKPNANKVDRTVLMLGSLRHQYMTDTFFGAFRTCRENKISLSWLLAGTMDAACKKGYQKHAHFPNVKYLGPCNNEKLPAVYNKASLFLHPRAGDSCPNVVLEAMACGLPVVCGSWGGAAELVGNSGGAVANIDRWAYGRKYETQCFYAIKEILKNQEAYSRKALKRVRKHFTVKIMADQYLEVIKK